MPNGLKLAAPSKPVCLTISDALYQKIQRANLSASKQRSPVPFVWVMNCGRRIAGISRLGVLFPSWVLKLQNAPTRSRIEHAKVREAVFDVACSCSVVRDIANRNACDVVLPVPFSCFIKRPFVKMNCRFYVRLSKLNANGPQFAQRLVMSKSHRNDEKQRGEKVPHRDRLWHDDPMLKRVDCVSVLRPVLERIRSNHKKQGIPRPRDWTCGLQSAQHLPKVTHGYPVLSWPACAPLGAFSRSLRSRQLNHRALSTSG